MRTPGCPGICGRDANRFRADLRAFTLADLRAIEHRINGRPRKRLSWRSPAHVMEVELAG